MPVSRTKQLEILQRRQQVSEYYLQGWTQSQVAVQFGVDQTTISDDLHKIRAEWRTSAVRDFDESRELELQKIDRIEREAWAAWERSKQPSQAATTTDGDHQRKTRRHVRNQHGDPRFLEQVNKCIASRRALLGLDAPGRLEVETNGGTVFSPFSAAASNLAARLLSCTSDKPQMSTPSSLAIRLVR
jgi:hypothetical protein